MCVISPDSTYGKIIATCKPNCGGRFATPLRVIRAAGQLCSRRLQMAWLSEVCQ